MRHLKRRSSRLPRRGPARWTPLEFTMLVLSILLIVFPLYAEAYRWINPVRVPAAQLDTPTMVGEPAPTVSDPEENAIVPQATRETFTPLPETPTVIGATATSTVAVPTDTPVVQPTDTAVPGTPTNTTEPPTATSTTEPGVPTNTTEPVPPTNTVVVDTPIPSATSIVGEPPVTIEKVASVAIARIGQDFSYSLSVFSSSTTPLAAQVTDSLDAQTEFVSAAASNGTCSESNRTVTCSITVQNGAPVGITIRVRVRLDAPNGGRIRNQASVRDDANNAASSDPVFVEISGFGPTVAPTNTPDPNQPTNTAVAPTATNQAPTTPPGEQPTTPPGGQPTSPPSGGGGSSNSDSPRATEPVPTTPPQPLLPPTPQVGPAAPAPQPTSAPARRPAATATPRPRAPIQQATRQVVQATGQASQATAAPTATSTPGTPTQVALENGLFFRMASDWGSVFPGNQVYYVIALRNNRAADGAELKNLRITSTLPSNLDVIKASTDTGDLKQDQNSLLLEVASLKPGQGVEIGVQTRVKPDVRAGTRIIAQASAFYDGLALPAYSNIVTVQVVDVVTAANQPGQAATATATATATSATAAATASATTAATTAATDTAMPAPTSSATATAMPTATPATAGGGSDALPPTNAGVPLLGFLLLGMTLMTRTVRLHRAQSRV